MHVPEAVTVAFIPTWNSQGVKVADKVQKRVRTCVGCKAQSDKLSLVRIVRMGDSTVILDETGRLSGRGAYVCSMKCLEGALSKRALQRALKCEIDQAVAKRLITDMATLTASVE